uniref:Uncharacterized protein n=1 Tax=Panagrolaimus sp. JU765 TaxID=591449 RepID=A0AC34QZT6_9BILA
MLIFLVFGLASATLTENEGSRTAFLNCVASKIPQDMGNAAHDFVRVLDLKNGPFFDASVVDAEQLRNLCSNAADELEAMKAAYQNCAQVDQELSKAMIGSILASQYLCQNVDDTIAKQKCILPILKDLQETRFMGQSPKHLLVGPIGLLCQHATGFYHAYGKRLKECNFNKDILIGYENYSFLGLTAKKDLPRMNYEKCAYRPAFP